MSIGSLPGVFLPERIGSATRTGSHPPASAADAAKSRAALNAEVRKTTLQEVREKGLYAWAQEQKYEALKEKIRKQILHERGLDDAALGKLNPDQRASVESSIEEEIAGRIKQAMEDALTGEAKAAARQGRPPQPMVIDISV